MWKHPYSNPETQSHRVLDIEVNFVDHSNPCVPQYSVRYTGYVCPISKLKLFAFSSIIWNLCKQRKNGTRSDILLYEIPKYIEIDSLCLMQGRLCNIHKELVWLQVFLHKHKPGLFNRGQLKSNKPLTRSKACNHTSKERGIRQLNHRTVKSWTNTVHRNSTTEPPNALGKLIKGGILKKASPEERVWWHRG